MFGVTNVGLVARTIAPVPVGVVAHTAVSVPVVVTGELLTVKSLGRLNPTLDTVPVPPEPPESPKSPLLVHVTRWPEVPFTEAVASKSPVPVPLMPNASVPLVVIGLPEIVICAGTVTATLVTVPDWQAKEALTSTPPVVACTQLPAVRLPNAIV
jgi:hypothetical protein